MIVLFSDFGWHDPYVGQMHAAILRQDPRAVVVDLLHNVPDFDIRAGAYLLPALAASFPEKTVFVAVVDPGVGGARRPIMLKADNRWYVGPDNGLLRLVKRRALRSETYEVLWRPQLLSASFHGRDLFAPVATHIAAGELPEHRNIALEDERTADWPDDLAQVVYIDHFGNAVTGLRAATAGDGARLRIGGLLLPRCRTFGDVAAGSAFCYENANGLLEIAVNQGSAAVQLGCGLGSPVELMP